MLVNQFPLFSKYQKEFHELDTQKIISDPYVTNLNFQDQYEFLRLSAYFKFATERNKRNMALLSFGKQINLIKTFIHKGDIYDFDRGLACGILFHLNLILVNTKRLKVFLGKSKSCLNGCFHKLGYAVSRIATEDHPQLYEFFKIYGRNVPNYRQWCIRTTDPLPNHSEPQSDNEIEIDPLEYGTSIKYLLNRKTNSL